jgi:hypothetical protein
MPSPAYTTFLASMKITYEQWHDGIGYDLDALRQIEPEERDAIETNLIDHLKSPGDWRDVEALHALGTPRAVTAVRDARRHPEAAVRKWAVQLGGDEADREAEVLRGLRSEDGWSAALDLARDCPTPAVKQALLDCARMGGPEARWNSAAMLLYLCGQAASPLDWAQRPFLLRFSSEDRAELRAAWSELRTRTGL